MKKVLLLTNKDYDNVGDQMIEACDQSLIRAAFDNLGVPEEEAAIISHGVSLIPNEYVSGHDRSLLAKAREAVAQTDLILFGGAPVFNYRYESFYEKTATWLELAAEYHRPVIFSAIGIEHVDKENPKCQRIQKALREAKVVMVTTRDGYEQMNWYAEGLDIIRGRVADPAVFTREIFAPYLAKADPENRRIGIFILRANGFLDNGLDVSHEKAASLWQDLLEACEKRGYEPYLLTSGFAADEAFLDYMIRHYHVPKERCIFNINTPEDLVEKISGMKAVISCRLHPGILSYSLGVPAVGIQWNPKVAMFYDQIGHSNRSLPVEGITADMLLDRLEEAMGDVAVRDHEMAWETYRTLVEGIRCCLYSDRQETVWGMEELLQRMRTYPGTPKAELNKKLEAKFRRAYVTYNNVFYKAQKNKKELEQTRERAEKSHQHALSLKEKNAQQQKKINTLKKKNAELKEELKKCREELEHVYSRSFLEMVANWSKGKEQYEKK